MLCLKAPLLRSGKLGLGIRILTTHTLIKPLCLPLLTLLRRGPDASCKSFHSYMEWMVREKISGVYSILGIRIF